ncbi:MAG: PKD domain-containing protein [Chitinophagales bacterium]|nr:PKD domain-containing protein [Chitinophagales bacterium]
MKKLTLLISMVLGLVVGTYAQNCRATFLHWSSPNNGYTVNFVDSSFVTNGGQVSTWAWNFGDGSTSNQANPVHTFSNAGTYYVCLSITSQFMGITCSDTYCDSVLVTGGSTATCGAGFQYTYTAINNNIVHFDNYSYASGIPSYLWSFGDGSTSTNFDPNHTYPGPGVYLACLTVTSRDSSGNITCTDDFCDSVRIYPMSGGNCSAAFQYSANPVDSTQISFFSVGGANTYGYFWSFGDSTVSTQANPTHSFPGAGTYWVCLTVTEYDSLQNIICTDDYCQTITIGGSSSSCSAAFQAVRAPINTLEFSFDNYSTGFNPTYHWDFGDGSSSNDFDPSHTYTTAGSYQVCLTIIDTVINCTSTFCDTVTAGGIIPTGCQAYFTPFVTVANNLRVEFDNGSTGANTVGTSYFWSFGDSTFSQLFSPDHTYAAPGVYQVCLTISVTDSVGNVTCTDTYCESVTVGSNTNNYSISGSIYHGNTTASAAMVYLISLDSTNLVLVRTSGVNAQGIYQFSNLASGQYLVKAALTPNDPDYSDYLPTYFGDELFWADATFITVGPDQTGQDIHLVQGSNPGGPGFVGGSIFNGANKSGDPAADVQVMLLNMDNTPVQYTFTDAAGEFSFDNVGYGTYKVYAEVLGKPTYPNIVTVSAATEVVSDLRIIIEDESVISGVEALPSYVKSVSLFPNPAVNNAVLRIDAVQEGSVNYSLVNMLGQEIITGVQQLNIGRNELSLELTGKAAGIYFLSLQGDNGNMATIKISKQ